MFKGALLDKLFVTAFRLHRIARSSTAKFMDLLLACHLADAACAVMNVVTALIFIILIVSWSHAFFLVVPVCSSLRVLVVVAVISYFQHTPAVRPDDTHFNFFESICRRCKQPLKLSGGAIWM